MATNRLQVAVRYSYNVKWQTNCFKLVSFRVQLFIYALFRSIGGDGELNDKVAESDGHEKSM